MKTYGYEQIADALGRLIDGGLRCVEPQAAALLNTAAAKETCEYTRWALNMIKDNAEIAERDGCFACQDCGLAMVFATLIALSRLYVGVHYPTDVLGGLIVGLFSGWAGWKIEELIMKKRAEKKKSADNK